MNIAQKLEKVLVFLEERRKGYKYSITLSTKDNQWVCSVVGESKIDKSYPHDFVSCKTEHFEDLPVLVEQQAKKLLEQEICRNNDFLKTIQETNAKLQKEFDSLQKLNMLN